MRTKKAIVHGKHSRKRNNHVGSSYSNKNNSDTSKRHRNHTMKGGTNFLRKVASKLEDKFSGCAVSSKMFENTKCFEEELTKKINEAVSQFVISNYLRSRVPNKLEDDRKELFTTIKRVLFPLLVNVMIMRENGKLLDNVQWDLGYSALVSIIILKFIDASIYKAAIAENLVDFSLFEDPKVLKDEEKCLKNLECSKLSPSSLSQILYFFFIENDTKKSAEFRGNLILRVKKYGDDYKIKQRGGSGTGSFVEVSARDVEGFGDQQQPGREKVPEPVDLTSPPTSTSTSPPPPPSTPRPNQRPKNLDILYSVAFPKEENQTKAKEVLDKLNTMYQGEEKSLEPDTFNEKMRFSLDDGSVESLLGGSVTLFNICMNIYSSKIFNTDTNLSAVSDEEFEEKLKAHGINRTQSKINKGKKVCLSHEEHLLCVGKMPEYLTEFDIPKQFQHKEKSIDEMGWGQTVFDKLKLVVFTEPDKETIQVGGSQTEASVVKGLPAYTGAPQNNQSESSVGSSTGKGLPQYKGAPSNNSSDSSQRGDSKPKYLGAPSYASSADTSVNRGSVSSRNSLPISAKNQGEVQSTNNPFYESASTQGSQGYLNISPDQGYTNLRRNPGKVQTPSHDEYNKLQLNQKQQDYNPKAFSIHQRIDGVSGLKMDEYLKNGDYFVKFRVPSLIKDKISKSGSDRAGVLGGKTTKKEKRMAFHYPIRFGPTFSKFVSLMLNGSSYYKSLEQAGHDIDKLIDMYRVYEIAQKDCDPEQLKVVINRPNVPPSPHPNSRSFPNPAYVTPPLSTGSDGNESSVSSSNLSNGGNIDPDTAALLASLTPELQQFIIRIIGENKGKKFNNRALAQMIYELISALRISKLESETGGGTDGGNNDGNGDNDKILEELYKILKIYSDSDKKLHDRLALLTKENSELLSQLEQIAKNLHGAEQLLTTKTAELEAKTAELEAQKEKFNELRRSYRKELEKLNTKFETKRQEIERQIALLEQRLQEQNAYLLRLQEELNDKSHLADYEQARANNLERQLAQEKDENARERDEALTAITAAERAIAELEAQIETLRQQNTQLNEENEALRASLTRFDEVQRERDELLKENNELTGRIKELLEELQKAQQEAAEARAAAEAQAEGNFLNEETIRRLTAEIARLKEENSNLERRLEEERAGYEQAQADLRNEFERFRTFLIDQTNAEMLRLEQENRRLENELNELRRLCDEEKRALAATNDELQRKLDECLAQKDAGGGFAPEVRPQCVEVNIALQLREQICKVMNKLKDLNPSVQTNLVKLIIIHDNGTYKQIPYADISKQCLETGTTKFVGTKVDLRQLKNYKGTPLIFNINSQATQFLDLDFMYHLYNENPHLKENYSHSASTVPVHFKEAEQRLVINEKFFGTGRGGTRTKKLNRVNKSRKKSKKINF